MTRYDRMGASSRVRFLQYIPHLQKMGLDIAVAPLLPDTYLTALYRDRSRSMTTVARAMARRFAVAVSSDAEIVWLQREMLPYAPYAVEKLLLAGRKLVIDFDDAHHLYYASSKFPFVRGLLGAKTDGLMRRADVVTVGNSALAGHARAAGATRVHVLPSAVNVSRFEERTPGEFTVGWIGTPVTAAESLPLIREPLVRFLNETGARCVFMGVREDQFPEIKATRLTWSEAGEVLFFASISVGLCPLPDTPWTRGKSGYKIIQYMAAGKPTLASPVGIAAQLVREGETGFQCSSPEQWYERLKELRQDMARTASFGHGAKSIAASEYDTAVTAGRLYKIFHDLGKVTPP